MKKAVLLITLIQICLSAICKSEAKPVAFACPESPQGTFSLSIQELTSIKCHGGYGILRAQLTVTSGTVSGIQYNWSGGGNTKDVIKSAGTYSVTVTTSNSGTKIASFTLKEPTEMYISEKEIIDGSAGGNGKFVVAVKGGTIPYFIKITNSNNQNFYSGIVSKITAFYPKGTYTIRIRDINGCELVETITLKTSTKAFTHAGINTTPVSCFQYTDGQIISTPEQIVPGSSKEFSWTIKDASGKVIHSDCCSTNTLKDELKAGTYTMEISMDACLCPKLIQSFTITQPAQLTGTGKVSDVDCFGHATGEIALTPLGGNGGYQYKWSHGSATKDIKGLTEGSYSVEITDSKNCLTNPSTLHFKVNQPEKIVNTDYTTMDISCYGHRNGEIIQSINGGTRPYQYAWQDGSEMANREKLLKGKYICLITDKNNCKSTFSYLIHEPDELIQLVDTIIAQTPEKKGAILLDVQGGFGQYYFDWTGPNGFKAGTKNISDLEPGEYALSIHDDNNCVSEKKYTVPFNTVSSTENSGNTTYEQTRGQITFRNLPRIGIKFARLVSVDGSMVNIPIETISDGMLVLDLNGIIPGIYVLQIASQNTMTSIKLHIN